MEGRHSRIHAIQKRAPHCNTAYLSHEMRFAMLQELAATSPCVLRQVQQQLHGMESSEGLRRPVMQLLNLHPAVEPLLERMKDPDVAKLVYKEHVFAKHSIRRRLMIEHEERTQAHGLELQQQPRRSILAGSGEDDSSNDAMTRLLVKYLVEAGRVNRVNCYSESWWLCRSCKFCLLKTQAEASRWRRTPVWMPRGGSWWQTTSCGRWRPGSAA